MAPTTPHTCGSQPAQGCLASATSQHESNDQVNSLVGDAAPQLLLGHIRAFNIHLVLSTAPPRQAQKGRRTEHKMQTQVCNQPYKPSTQNRQKYVLACIYSPPRTTASPGKPQRLGDARPCEGAAVKRRLGIWPIRTMTVLTALAPSAMRSMKPLPLDPPACIRRSKKKTRELACKHRRSHCIYLGRCAGGRT